MDGEMKIWGSRGRTGAPVIYTGRPKVIILRVITFLFGARVQQIVSLVFEMNGEEKKEMDEVNENG